MNIATICSSVLLLAMATGMHGADKQEAIKLSDPVVVAQADRTTGDLTLSVGLRFQAVGEALQIHPADPTKYHVDSAALKEVPVLLTTTPPGYNETIKAVAVGADGVKATVVLSGPLSVRSFRLIDPAAKTMQIKLSYVQDVGSSNVVTADVQIADR